MKTQMVFGRVFCLKLVYQVTQVGCPGFKKVLEAVRIDRTEGEEWREKSREWSTKEGNSSGEIFGMASMCDNCVEYVGRRVVWAAQK